MINIDENHSNDPGKLAVTLVEFLINNSTITSKNQWLIPKFVYLALFVISKLPKENVIYD